MKDRDRLTLGVLLMVLAIKPSVDSLTIYIAWALWLFISLTDFMFGPQIRRYLIRRRDE